MATGASYEEFEEHLLDRERFMKGGRDTALLVWTLLALMVASFLLMSLAAGGPVLGGTGNGALGERTATGPVPAAQDTP